MKQILIADTTLCNANYSFKEKLEIARCLEKLSVDRIELPEITNVKTDKLLVRTISSFVKKSVLSVAAGSTLESVENALEALQHTAKPSIRIQVPVSPVGMEYIAKKKAPSMLEWIQKSVEMAAKSCEVEFCAVDATRAEPEFLKAAIDTAVKAGAALISVCDTAAGMMPDEFAALSSGYCGEGYKTGVLTSDQNGMALAQAILAVRAGVDMIKTSVTGDTVKLDVLGTMIRNCGNNYDFCANLNQTQLQRMVHQIRWISDSASRDKAVVTTTVIDESMKLDQNDTKEAVVITAAKLGYDLSEEDQDRVYDEFKRVASKKSVGPRELDAIIASVALQVPATYVLENYVINNGNIISATAQITLKKGEETLQGISIGDGPIDAAFLALEQITGHHYDLDDFQIQSVTEGKEAMGSALVKLRSNGKLYSGHGISTDIIGASIRAYLSAVNKIAYVNA